MEIDIRAMNLKDVEWIATVWLTAYRIVARPDMPLAADAAGKLRSWLVSRLGDPAALGYLADSALGPLGFLLGRVGVWESEPPILEARRVGIIDALYVAEGFRGQGIGRQLVQHAIEMMRKHRVTAIETVFEPHNEPAARMWERLGFTPWLESAYRLL